MLDIAAHGDILERSYSTFIRENITAYEEIWKRYIGNDGTAHIIDLPALTEEEKKKRKLFSQYHYSLLESVICLKRIVETKLSFSPVNIEEYLDMITLFLAFQAHAGRIRDCIKEMGNQFKMPNLHSHLDDLYQQRNTTLHGCKLPFKIIDGSISIPLIKGVDEDPSKWNDTLTWDEAEKLDFKPIKDCLSDTYLQLLPVVNRCLYQLLEKIKEFVSKKNIDYKSFMSLLTSETPPTSGCTCPVDNAVLNQIFDSSSLIKDEIKIIYKKEKGQK